MRRTAAAAAMLGLLMIGAGCAPDATRSGAEGRGLPPAAVEDPGPPPPRREDVRVVMRAKLSRAHALLEAIALEAFGPIEVNATELGRLSREAGWRAHPTTAYDLFSVEFRQITESMADHARHRNLDGVTFDYTQMTTTCVRCHSYLRSEGLVEDLPGAVSSRRKG